MPDVLTDASMTLVQMIERSGMTRVELAKRAGLSRVGLYLWMRRESAGKASTAQRVAAALGVTVEQLLKAKEKGKR